VSQDISALDEATTLLRSPATRIAVVGASNDPSKYGNIIVRNLIGHGYQVLPVNPKEGTIAGLPAYRSLEDVPKPVHIVDVVTPPAVTLRVLEDAATSGASLVWLQDGSFDERVLEALRGAPFRTVHHACIMVVARQAHPSTSK
jgi:predicted CoA-binding protein